MNTSLIELNVDPLDPMVVQGQMYAQTFNQPSNINQERTDPMSFYNPNMALNANRNPQMMNSWNAYTGLNPMSRPQLHQQHMWGAPRISGRMMMPPSNIPIPQPRSLSGNRYPIPFQSSTNNNMIIWNRLPNPGSSLTGQNFAAVRALSSNVNRPSLSPRGIPYSPYSTSPTPGPYRHIGPMAHNPYFNRDQADHYNPNLVSPSSQNINTVNSVASNVVSSNTSQQPKVCE